MKSIASKDTHQQFVDGLRGIAILSVLANHWYHYTLGAGHEWRFLNLHGWLDAGSLGVALFFLVSAFTLCLSGKKRSFEKYPVLNFYIRRAFRILPLWWLCLAVLCFIKKMPLSEHVCCVFLYFPLLTDKFHPLLVGWSLSVEESFYIFFPVLFLWVTNMRRAVALFCVTYLIRLLWNSHLLLEPFLSAHSMHPFAPIFAPALWYCFATGMILCYVFETPVVREKIMGKQRWAPVLDTAAILSAIIFLRGASWEGRAGEMAVFSWAVIFLAAMSKYTLVGKLCRHRILGRFGICCYSLYLIPEVLMERFGHAIKTRILLPLGVPHWPSDIQFLTTFPIYAFGLLALAHFTFNYFEVPCVRLGKRVIRTIERGKILSLQFGWAEPK
jgi:peptidoglycan/LPS O-acetylase OafA/YrhL